MLYYCPHYQPYVWLIFKRAIDQQQFHTRLATYTSVLQQQDFPFLRQPFMVPMTMRDPHLCTSGACLICCVDRTDLGQKQASPLLSAGI